MLILVLGGTRSGKSAAAESLVQRLPEPVTYVATLVPSESDPEMAQRIDRHRSRRPATWTTIDATEHLTGQLRDLSGTVLLDSLGPWVALHQPDAAAIAGLADALVGRNGDTVVVSDEVGLSVHPESDSGRAFQDAVGRANERLAAVADQTILVVAGRMLVTTPIDAATIVDGHT